MVFPQYKFYLFFCCIPFLNLIVNYSVVVICVQEEQISLNLTENQKTQHSLFRKFSEDVAAERSEIDENKTTGIKVGQCGCCKAKSNIFLEYPQVAREEDIAIPVAFRKGRKRKKTKEKKMYVENRLKKFI